MEYGTHTTEEFNLGKKRINKPQEKNEPRNDRSCYETLVNHSPSLANILLFEGTVISITNHVANGLHEQRGTNIHPKTIIL